MKTLRKKKPGCRNANCPETKSWKRSTSGWLAVLCWAVWELGPRAVAQTPAELDLQLYAGLSITGAVGTVYSIEYVTDLTQTNTPSAWRCLEFLQLPTKVSWSDAANYCAALTERERAAGRIGTNWVYRLPTEAEWEYACRAWTSTRFSYGDDLGYTNLINYAWYYDNSGETTHPVGQKLPNPWGLYDMHGNVWEWCQDRFDTYPGGIALDPLGPATGSNRVFRGGGWSDWFNSARHCRSASRGVGSPDFRGDFIGFRVLLAPGQP